MATFRPGRYSDNVEGLCMLHAPMFQTVFLYLCFIWAFVCVGACGFKASRERVTVRAVGSRSLTDVAAAHTWGRSPILQHQKTECWATAHCCQGRGECVCTFDMMTYHMRVLQQKKVTFQRAWNFFFYTGVFFLMSVLPEHNNF